MSDVLKNFWFVGDERTKVFSSEKMDFVPLSVKEYKGFVKLSQASYAKTIEDVLGVIRDRKIAEIEATITQRRIRDAILTKEGKAWLQDAEDRIAEIRKEANTNG